MLTFLISLAALNTLLGVFSYKHVPAWNSRDFNVRGLNWNIVIPGSIASSVILSTAVYFYTNNLWVSLSIALVGFIFPLATATDLSVSKIPQDISVLAYLLPIPLILLCWPSLDQTTVIFWAIMAFLFGALSFVGLGLGFADVRLFILFGTAFSWWMGMMNMTYALLIATVLQLLIHLIGPHINLGVKKTKEENAVYDATTRRLVAESSIVVEETHPVVTNGDILPEEDSDNNTENVVIDTDNEHKQPKSKSAEKRAQRKAKRKAKKRFHAPYGPSLLLGYLIVAMYTAFTSPVLISPFVFWQ